MSERERWIVYPLIFLALGAALRDKLAKRSVSEHVICEKLSVIDDQGRVVAELLGGTITLANVQADRVRANAVEAGNLPRVAADGQPSAMLPLPQLLDLLRRAGAVIAPPATQPAPRPPDAEPAPPPADE